MSKRFTLVVLILLAGIALPLAATPASAQTGGSLANTKWVLAETAVQRATFVPALGSPPPTLNFSSDGKISGSTICNSFSGPYTQGSSQLTVGDLVSTLRACTDDNLNKQEQLMLSVLKGQVAYTLSGNKLTLSAPAGALNFVPASGSGAGSSSGSGSASGSGTSSSAPQAPATGNPGPANSAGLSFPLLGLTVLTTVSGLLYVYTRRSARR